MKIRLEERWRGDKFGPLEPLLAAGRKAPPHEHQKGHCTMKKTVAMLSAAVFALSLAACGASSTASADENAAAPQSGAAAATRRRRAHRHCAADGPRQP